MKLPSSKPCTAFSIAVSRDMPITPMFPDAGTVRPQKLGWQADWPPAQCRQPAGSFLAYQAWETRVRHAGGLMNKSLIAAAAAMLLTVAGSPSDGAAQGANERVRKINLYTWPQAALPQVFQA